MRRKKKAKRNSLDEWMNEPSSRRQHHMGWVTVSMATAGGGWRHRPPEEHVWLFIYLPFICHQFETKSILFVCRFRLMTLFRWYLMRWQEYLRCLLTMFLPRADALLIKLSILFSFSMQVFLHVLHSNTVVVLHGCELLLHHCYFSHGLTAGGDSACWLVPPV